MLIWDSAARGLVRCARKRVLGQRLEWSCPHACPSTCAHACTCGCPQHTCSLTTVPSAQRRHAVGDYSNADAHAIAPIAPPYARARAIARRGSYTAHSCVKKTDVATQRMSTRRSQCDGDRMHPVRGRNGPSPPLRPPSSRPPPAWPAKPERAAELQSPARANPGQIWVRKDRKTSPRDYARVERARTKLMGPQCRCAVRNATATRVGVRARRTWGVQPQPATLKNACST